MADIPYIKDGQLFTAEGVLICPVEGSDKETKSTPWMRWLRDPKNKSFSYASELGSFTGIKEVKRFKNKGTEGVYWYGHRHVGGELRRKSLGSIRYSRNITLQKMADIAAQLARGKLREAAGEALPEWKQAEKRQAHQGTYYPPGRLPINRGEPVTASQVGLFADTGQDSDADPGGGGAAYEL
jgi:hypothetical protein